MIRAPCCNEIFPCRYCHNETMVICSVCDTERQVARICANCGVNMGEYFCGICKFYDDDPATLGSNVKSVFTCLLDQVSQYITEGLERARESLNEATALRERYVLGASVSRRVAAAAASAAEAAAAAGESSFRLFMGAVQRCASSVAIVQSSTTIWKSSEFGLLISNLSVRTVGSVNGSNKKGGGLVGEDDRCNFSQFQAKKMENWEDQVSYPTQGVHVVDVKQESSEGGYRKLHLLI